ncbi:MAG: hypothetical protein JRD93_20330 [Deltaproteobacteria bacterium]|nr:hypothetical protein [Deltaproteobacteria bacterium]
MSYVQKTWNKRHFNLKNVSVTEDGDEVEKEVAKTCSLCKGINILLA